MVAAHRLSGSGARLWHSCSARALWHAGFSSLGIHSQGLWRMGLFISCSTGMWNFPRPGVKPISPALAGGFLTTGPPGKSSGSLTYHFFTCTQFCLCRTYFSGLYIKSVILKSYVSDWKKSFVWFLNALTREQILDAVMFYCFKTIISGLYGCRGVLPCYSFVDNPFFLLTLKLCVCCLAVLFLFILGSPYFLNLKIHVFP